jgi:serine protease Do
MAAIHSLTTKHLFSVVSLCVIGLLFLPLQAASAIDLPDFKRLVEEKGPAVVQVTVTARSERADDFDSLPNFNEDELPEFYRRFFDELPDQPNGLPPPGVPQSGFGSGFVISADGYVVTNAHVIDGAETILVSLPDQRQFDASVIGADERTDIAVLKVNANELPVLELGDSGELKVGQWVLAIGSPFGFEYTATQGIVSALARSLPSDSYVPFIQTDVAVNPGNSGGPLFDLDGQVVGVNSQIFSRSGGYMGLSFAIPSNTVRAVTEQLLSKGYVSRGWLGVTIQDVNQALAESFGLDKPAGALIASVTDGGPASQAGIEPGDVILSFNGEAVSLSSDLPPLVGSAVVDSNASVVLLRDRQEITLDVMIEELAEQRGAGSGPVVNRRIGLIVDAISEDGRAALNIQNGVEVTGVDPDGVAAAAGIVKGDVITSYGDEPVSSPAQFSKLVSDSDNETSVAVLIYRNGNPLFIALPIPGDR